MQQQFEAKESSNVAWARYDADTRTLEVDFKKDGVRSSTYIYLEFPPEEWQAFQEAKSKGQHFAYKIRPRFKGTKKA
jgi:hypothetical protein